MVLMAFIFSLIFYFCENLFFKWKGEYHWGAEILSFAFAQKMSKTLVSPSSRRPVTGDWRNCFPNPNSFKRTETLILSISFDYSYHFSSSPTSNTIYLGIFDSPATVTNLFSSPLAYYLTISTQLSQESDTQHILETWNHTLLADYYTASLWGYSIQI